MITRHTKHLQWTVKVNEGTGAYRICNFGSNGEKQFCEVVPGKYGEPIIVAEPDLAFPPPTNLRYVNADGDNVKPDQLIASIILAGDHEGGPRILLTNAKLMGVVIKVNEEDGSLHVGGEKWWIVTLFLKDENHFRGYDAFCAREQPEKVRVLELCDLNHFL